MTTFIVGGNYRTEENINEVDNIQEKVFNIFLLRNKRE